MRTAIYALLILALTATLGAAQQPSQTGFWQGKLQTYAFNFFGVVDPSAWPREGLVQRMDYDLYQNPSGLAREELTNLTRTKLMTNLGYPYNIRILDYPHNHGVVFVERGQDGAEGPWVPVPGVALPQPRTILGFRCEGKRYRWTTFQKATVELDTWTAQDSSLRVPLLEVKYVTESRWSLLGVDVVMVTELEPVSSLPASLFEVPEGVRPTHVESVWGL